MKNRTEIVNELCAAIEQDRRSVFNIAKAAGISDKALYCWLRGATANPKIDSIAKVAQVLGLQVAFIDGQPRLKPVSTPASAARAAKRARLALWRLQ
jgi:DNA-binding phage protein